MATQATRAIQETKTTQATHKVIPAQYDESDTSEYIAGLDETLRKFDRELTWKHFQGLVRRYPIPLGLAGELVLRQRKDNRLVFQVGVREEMTYDELVQWDKDTESVDFYMGHVGKVQNLPLAKALLRYEGIIKADSKTIPLTRGELLQFTLPDRWDFESRVKSNFTFCCDLATLMIESQPSRAYDLNSCSKEDLKQIHGLSDPLIGRILSARPLRSLDDLALPESVELDQLTRFTYIQPVQ